MNRTITAIEWEFDSIVTPLILNNQSLQAKIEKKSTMKKNTAGKTALYFKVIDLSWEWYMDLTLFQGLFILRNINMTLLRQSQRTSFHGRVFLWHEFFKLTIESLSRNNYIQVICHHYWVEQKKKIALSKGFNTFHNFIGFYQKTVAVDIIWY